MNYLLFTIIFIFLTNWQAVIALVLKPIFGKTKIVEYEDKWLKEFLKQKTRLEFRIKRSVSNTYNGFSLLYPKNTMVLSSRVIDDFSKDEMEWIALHEGGHVYFKHDIKMALTDLLFVLSGSYLISKYNIDLLLSLLLAVILTTLCQKIHRQFELQTDRFATKNMTDPQGMIDANKKFNKANTNFIYRSNLLRSLFTPHPSYEERMQMAREEIAKRAQRK